MCKVVASHQQAASVCMLVASHLAGDVHSSFVGGPVCTWVACAEAEVAEEEGGGLLHSYLLQLWLLALHTGLTGRA